MNHEHLRILVSHEEEMLVAQCLEHDICVQAADLETLQKRFAATLLIENQSGDLASIPPAPADFEQKWAQAEELESCMPNAEVRMAA
jgi:hypothetical protein